MWRIKFFGFEVHLFIFCGERISDVKRLKYPSYYPTVECCCFGNSAILALKVTGTYLKYFFIYFLYVILCCYLGNGATLALLRNGATLVLLGNGATLALLGNGATLALLGNGVTIWVILKKSSKLTVLKY